MSFDFNTVENISYTDLPNPFKLQLICKITFPNTDFIYYDTAKILCDFIGNKWSIWDTYNEEVPGNLTYLRKRPYVKRIIRKSENTDCDSKDNICFNKLELFKHRTYASWNSVINDLNHLIQKISSIKNSPLLKNMVSISHIIIKGGINTNIDFLDLNLFTNSMDHLLGRSTLYFNNITFNTVNSDIICNSYIPPIIFENCTIKHLIEKSITFQYRHCTIFDITKNAPELPLNAPYCISILR